MLTQWIKSVLICALLFSVVVYIAPNPQMKRYVQTAVGFVMIIVVLSPVLELLKCEDRLTFDVLTESLDMGISAEEDEVYVSAMQQVVENYISDTYGIKADVVITIDDDLQLERILVTPDYRYMSDMGTTADSGIYAEMKQKLAAEYGVDEDKVTVM